MKAEEVIQDALAKGREEKVGSLAVLGPREIQEGAVPGRHDGHDGGKQSGGRGHDR